MGKIPGVNWCFLFCFVKKNGRGKGGKYPRNDGNSKANPRRWNYFKKTWISILVAPSQLELASVVFLCIM